MPVHFARIVAIATFGFAAATALAQAATVKRYGEAFDEGKLVNVSAGRVWTEPAGVAHFGWAKDGEAMLLLVANGPTGTTPVPQKP